MKNKERGLTLGFSMILTAVMIIMITAMVKTIDRISRDEVYFNGMQRAYRLSESITGQALGKITTDPGAMIFSGLHTSSHDRYKVTLNRRDYDNIRNGYYFVTEATTTISGKTYTTKLHTYAQLSNVSDYFAAINGDLEISHGVNVEQGKIFAKNLLLYAGLNPPNTRIKTVEYNQSFKINWNGSTVLWPDQLAIPSIYRIEILDSPHVATKTSLLFPQLLDTDISNYAEKAHVDINDPGNTAAGRHHKCSFTGNILPPSYMGYPPTSEAYDDHVSGTNSDHVYFCTGTMSVQGTVYGQVLLVAAGDIRISSSIFSANPASFMPGAGILSTHIGSSTAHQLILMTRGSVIIDSTTFLGPNVPLFNGSTQTIQALIMAPNGSVLTQRPDTVTSSNLYLDFRGSLILNASPDFANYYRGGRSYAYMQTLRTNPPPDMPYLMDVRYSFEETVGRRE